MHQVGAVPGHRLVHVPPGQADPEPRVQAGQRQRRHPDDRETETGVGPLLAAGRLGGDDQRLVAPGQQMLGDPDRGMRDAVDRGREGLRDIRDSHGLTV